MNREVMQTYLNIVLTFIVLNNLNLHIAVLWSQGNEKKCVVLRVGNTLMKFIKS